MPIPETMAAVVLTGHGGLDKLEYHDNWPTPRPGPGEVLVRVGACGLNNTDINTRTAWYSDEISQGITPDAGQRGFDHDDSRGWGGSALDFPRIQGADVAGTIAAVGDGVGAGRVGERVIVDPWLLPPGNWQDASRAAYVGSEIDGGYAEYLRIPTDNAIRIDTQLSDAELATFPCASGTAENLVGRSGLQPGETVVVSGASGGVGSAAVQLCRLRGARVIAIAAAEKSDQLIELGAARVIDRHRDDLEDAIREAADGPVDAALDVVGGALFRPLIGALRHGGRYSSSGCIAGPGVDFDLRQLIYRDLQMTGATIAPPGTMQRLARLIERRALRPLLARCFPLAELAAAQQAFLAKRHVGNIVVTT